MAIMPTTDNHKKQTEMDKAKKIWFVTGSQHLYGSEILKQVDSNTRLIVKGLNTSTTLPVKVEQMDVVTTSDEIHKLFKKANGDYQCIGLILWMHTFSPAKMWIRGLKACAKPICHLHTQFNSEIPWETIDMDFMNLNQSAHGDRELGFIMTKMKLSRKVIVGHWESEQVHRQLNTWSRVAMAWDEMQTLKVARIGDNMRDVAVTEGDKVDAQIKFGFSVNGYATSDVLAFLPDSDSKEVKSLLELYGDEYDLTASLQSGGDQRSSLVEAAKIELALRSFLEEGDFGAFTNTFENLGAFKQLPGIAVQRLMMQGYGFGAEGDWKTAAMLRAMKVMSKSLIGGTSFMEDYTYHLTPSRHLVLGSHMLEICPSIADVKPSCEVHPLGIGGKADPVRLVFNGKAGPAINASLIDLGNRFRLVVNEVEAVQARRDLPMLPTARVLWQAKPNLETAATAWILAGGAHHTVYSQALTTDFMEDFAELAGIEIVVIDDETKIRSFKHELRANERFYG